MEKSELGRLTYMKVLVLGGTKFLGRAIVEELLNQGHEVTLFHRGQTNPDLFPEVEKLIGNRDGDLKVLKGRSWDAVIDPSGYIPRVVKESCSLLADFTDHYTFISSISVYESFKQSNIDESFAVGKLKDDKVEEITGETYGPLKALCEEVVQESFPQGSLIIRPGLIVGPHDPTDRFSYWPNRIEQGGDVLVPGDKDAPFQVIDARDLAKWVVLMIEKKKTGVFNATGPESPIAFQDFINTCLHVSQSNAKTKWVSDQFLKENEVGYWIELPLYIPKEKNMDGMSTANCQRAIQNGLRFRPLEETIKDTLDWIKTRPASYEWKAGLDAKKEKELLSNWK